LGYWEGCRLYLSRFLSATTPAIQQFHWQERACRTGIEEACRAATRLALTGTGTAGQHRSLEQLVLKQCKERDSSLCIQVAQLMKRRRAAALARFPKPWRKRYRWYLTACRSGYLQGCFYANRAAPTGTAGLPDLRTFRRKLTKGCGEIGPGDKGCHTVALMMLAGVGGKVDRPGGVKAMETACMSQSWARSCLTVGYGWLTGKWGHRDFAKATEYLNRGCDTRWFICRDSARVHLKGPWKRLKEQDQARSSFERACVYNGYAHACVLRAVHWPNKDIEEVEPGGKSPALLRYVCFPGRRPACKPGQKSTMWSKGRWKALTRRRALRLLSVACKGGVVRACNLSVSSGAAGKSARSRRRRRRRR
jgi:TPR repeat protein